MKMTRRELYVQVCSAPLNKIAPEFGISGQALAAVCKLNQIPYPGSAYWTRKSIGLEVQVPSLPEGPDDLIEITAKVRKSRQKKTIEDIPKGSVKEVKKAPRLKHHRLLLGIEAHMLKTRPVKAGEFLRPFKRILPDLISSQEALPRACSIANELYNALEKQGYYVGIALPKDGNGRIRIQEQEIEPKVRSYGQYYSSNIWGPDRPTVVYIDQVPIGLALIEMTERVTLRYFNGDYHREDSRLVQSMKTWQLANSWTTERDMTSGRFRIIAYSPKYGVDWSVRWQEDGKRSIISDIPKIIETLRASADELQRLMTAEDEAEAKRKIERQQERERYERHEDERKVVQALSDSQKQLSEIIENWGKAMVVEHFFHEVEKRLEGTDNDRRHRLMERLALARATMGSVDPLDFIEYWQAPNERYRSRYDHSEGSQ